MYPQHCGDTRAHVNSAVVVAAAVAVAAVVAVAAAAPAV
jgi:hypothetical protein